MRAASAGEMVIEISRHLSGGSDNYRKPLSTRCKCMCPKPCLARESNSRATAALAAALTSRCAFCRPLLRAMCAPSPLAFPPPQRLPHWQLRRATGSRQRGLAARRLAWVLGCGVSLGLPCEKRPSEARGAQVNKLFRVPYSTFNNSRQLALSTLPHSNLLTSDGINPARCAASRSVSSLLRLQ